MSNWLWWILFYISDSINNGAKICISCYWKSWLRVSVVNGFLGRFYLFYSISMNTIAQFIALLLAVLEQELFDLSSHIRSYSNTEQKLVNAIYILEKWHLKAFLARLGSARLGLSLQLFSNIYPTPSVRAPSSISISHPNSTNYFLKNTAIVRPLY